MAEERERNKPGQKIRAYFENGHISRDAVLDNIVLTTTIHDDIIDRGFKIGTVSTDETGHFLTVIFVKREEYLG